MLAAHTQRSSMNNHPSLHSCHVSRQFTTNPAPLAWSLHSSSGGSRKGSEVRFSAPAWSIVVGCGVLGNYSKQCSKNRSIRTPTCTSREVECCGTAAFSINLDAAADCVDAETEGDSNSKKHFAATKLYSIPPDAIITTAIASTWRT